MSTQLLSFPFRLDKQGYAVTNDDESDVYCAERLSVLLGTRPGERQMAPAFGVNDPAFEGFTASALSVQVAQYGLPVEITRIRRSYLNDAQENVVVEFNMAQGAVRSN
ncbi:baseplate protein [Gordonia phage GMA6]|uniref:Putative lysozyme n=1 Tax=Gordonia phage GMA6 TaxID=1647285 RepID=A0A0K0NKR9_9CAUD|nr:baseplate protein [Gordonia phage GMA6]AKL88321.1 putative lysozyme [Gordonia phage GMA6]